MNKVELPTYKVEINYSWCKSCGICVALCPKEVLQQDADKRPFVAEEEKCVNCQICVYHCPDFAIEIKEKSPNTEEK